MADTERVNETLSEIKDQRTRAKLEGIQECVWSFDEQIVQLRQAIIDKKAGAVALRDFAKLVFGDCDALNAKVRAGEMPAAEAKIRISEITRIKALAEARATETQVDAYKHEGEISGLQRAAKISNIKFTEHVQKYERWQRIKAEEQQKQAEDAEAAASAKKQAADGPASKGNGEAKPRAKKRAKRKVTRKE